MSKSPAPLNIPPSLYWDGNDGSWSTFHVQVGTPGQAVRLLPGTSASASDTTWVVRDEGCTIANPNLTNCEDGRGLLFDPSKSTSWSTERLENNGLFELNTYYEGFLNLTGNAYYGFDTVTLGLPGSDLPSLEDQIIAGFATNNYWLGYLGLSPVSFNFSSQNDSTSMQDAQPSLLSNLKNQSLIPSLSWGYTAGASYRSDPVFGSLVLGGYDRNRLVENEVSFSFAEDFSRDLTVYLRSISYDTLGSSPLLAESIPVFINSVVTHLWLPTEVCQRFEKAFNLTWNDDQQVYLLDSDTHARLASLNPTFTLTLGHAGTEGDTVDIVLPYGAFDLTGSVPFTDPPSKYFPLKRAEKPEQYTLGRVFLQGAYIVADYERQTFSVSQAVFPDASNKSETNLVPITALGSEDSKGLGAGAIAGIAVGSAVLVLLIFGAFYWCVRRRTTDSSKDVEIVEAKPHLDKSESTGTELDGERSQVHEMGNNGRKVGELDGVQTSLAELDPQHERKAELAADVDIVKKVDRPVRFELP